MLQMHVSLLHVNYASLLMICLQMIVWLRLSGGNLDKSTKEACYKIHYALFHRCYQGVPQG